MARAGTRVAALTGGKRHAKSNIELARPRTPFDANLALTETSERLIAIVTRVAARLDELAEEREGTKP
jgi:hypothetical protein